MSGEEIAIRFGAALLVTTVAYIVCSRLLPWLDKNERENKE